MLPAPPHTAGAVLELLWLDPAALHMPVQAWKCKLAGQAALVYAQCMSKCYASAWQKLITTLCAFQAIGSLEQTHIVCEGIRDTEACASSHKLADYTNLSSLILEDFLFPPACTELLLQLFNGNLHQGRVSLQCYPGECDVTRLTDEIHLGFKQQSATLLQVSISLPEECLQAVSVSQTETRAVLLMRYC